jgi:CBS domain-containing protein
MNLVFRSKPWTLKRTGSMKLAELATRKVITLSTTEPIARALVLMQEEEIRHIPILRTRVPVGMVSDHDVLAYVGWLHRGRSGPATHTARVEKIMTSPLVSLSPEDPIENAARLMLNRRIGAVALMDGDHLAGIVTETDLLRFITEIHQFSNSTWRTRSIASSMSSEVIHVLPGAATLDAFKLMRAHQIRHLPVVENERPVGILSYRDIFRGESREAPGKSAFLPNSAVVSPLHVRGIMSTDVVTLESSATLAAAAEHMAKARIGAIPVMEEERLCGIITETDLLRSLVEA